MLATTKRPSRWPTRWPEPAGPSGNIERRSNQDLHSTEAPLSPNTACEETHRFMTQQGGPAPHKADNKFGRFDAALSEWPVVRGTHDGLIAARSRSTRDRIYACNESNLMNRSVLGCGRSPYTICYVPRLATSFLYLKTLADNSLTKSFPSLASFFNRD